MLIYASCSRGQRMKHKSEKKFEKTRKKFLTNEISCANICKLSTRAAANWKEQQKEIWKNLKKVLDKCKMLWYSKWAIRESEQRTLYIVNWIMQRQTITPWTIIMDCLSVFRNEFITANENSWVYLLDKFIQNFDLSSSEFRYNFLRVWSWLRTNAGGVPNTCKSNGVPSGT